MEGVTRDMMRYRVFAAVLALFALTLVAGTPHVSVGTAVWAWLAWAVAAVYTWPHLRARTERV